MFSSIAFLALFPAAALATVYTTSPVGSTTFTAGEEVTISWQDDGSAPSLQDFGNAMVSIYVGNALQQTSLQLISDSVDVATTSSIRFTPDASIGPNGNEYFIRFESLALKDAASPQFPALAFSAKYTMAGMSGEFSPAIQAQIDGQSTAPISGPLPPTATGSSPTTTSRSSSTSNTSTGTATGSNASATESNAATHSGVQWPLSIMAAVFALSYL